MPGNSSSACNKNNQTFDEDWSSLLYKSEGYTEPREPYRGLYLGTGNFKLLGIGTWVRLFAYSQKISVEPRRGSNTTYKKWGCSCNTCPWYLSVKAVSKEDKLDWRVVGFHGKHSATCTSTVSDNTPIVSDIAKLLLDCDSAKLSYHGAQEQLSKLDLPVEYIGKSKLFRSVAIRNAKTIGYFTDGFKVLESYLQNLMLENPGSVYSYETVKDAEGNNRFGRLAIVLKAEIDMVLNCKPILSFDGGHVKHVMWGSYQVLVCGTQDAENRDCSIGLAIVPNESEDSYRFFIQTMKKSPALKSYFDTNKLVVTSDIAKGLQNAIKAELPNAFHRFCSLHLLGNIEAGRSFNENERTLYWDIVFSESEARFKENMEKLEAVHNEAFEFLNTLNPAEWTNWAFPAPTWGHLTNNLSERAVKFIGTDNHNGRRQPIVDLLNEIISKQNTRIMQRRLSDHKYQLQVGTTGSSPHIAQEAMKIVERNLKRAQLLRVQKVNDHSDSYNVFFRQREIKRSVSGKDTTEIELLQEVENKVIVNLTKRDLNCSCLMKSDNMIPCSHIIAVLINQNKQHILYSPQYTDMLYHKCYHWKALNDAYKSTIMGVFGPLESSNTLGPIMSSTSNLGKKRIRSSHNRLQSTTSGTKPKCCTCCKLSGHNLKNCPFKLMSDVDRKRSIADFVSNQRGSSAEHVKLKFKDSTEDLSNKIKKKAKLAKIILNNSHCLLDENMDDDQIINCSSSEDDEDYDEVDDNQDCVEENDDLLFQRSTRNNTCCNNTDDDDDQVPETNELLQPDTNIEIKSINWQQEMMDSFDKYISKRLGPSDQDEQAITANTMPPPLPYDNNSAAAEDDGKDYEDKFFFEVLSRKH